MASRNCLRYVISPGLLTASQASRLGFDVTGFADLGIAGLLRLALMSALAVLA